MTVFGRSSLVDRSRWKVGRWIVVGAKARNFRLNRYYYWRQFGRVMNLEEDCVSPGPSRALPGQNALFSLVSIPAGANILSIERPLVEIVDSAHLAQVCDNCFVWLPESASASSSGAPLLKRCLGCRTAMYCSKVRMKRSTFSFEQRILLSAEDFMIS